MESHFKPPASLSLDGNIAENWRKWRQRFETYLLAAGADRKPDKVKVAILLHTAGEEAMELFNTFDFDDEGDKDKLDKVLEKFQAHCEPKRNTVFARYVLSQRFQNDNESFDQFITDVKNLVKDCDYGEQTNSIIRDRIVFGVKDARLKESLLKKTPELNLDEAIKACRIAELNAKQIKVLAKQDNGGLQPTGLDLEVHATSKSNSKQKFKDYSDTKKQGNIKLQKQQKPCRRCGTVHPPRACPAWGKECLKCKGKHHFANMCKTKRVFDLEQECSQEPSDELFIGSVNNSSEIQSDSNDLWKEFLNVEGTIIGFKLDTGAQANILSKCDLDKIHGINHSDLKKTSVVLKAYGNFSIKPLGSITLMVYLKGQKFRLKFFVVDVDSPPILGINACTTLGLIKRLHTVDTDTVKTEKQKLLEKYPDVFNGIGKMSEKYKIVLKEGSTPVIHPPRKVPFSRMNKLKETLNALVQKGIIAKLDKPPERVNSLVMVEKTDGSLRLCLDPSDLNEAILKDPHVIPTVEDVAAKLSNKSVFSTLDMKDGFWNIELDEESSYLCSFNTPFGLFRFQRLPFGINVAPEVFQRFNEKCFGDIEGVHVTHDDIIIAGSNDPEHDAIMDNFLNRAREKNVKFNPKKLQIKQEHVTYLGCLITAEGLKPDQEKVKAILDMPDPTDKKQLQRILGMINFVGKFIPNLSELTAPLRTLLQKEVTWYWHPSQQRALLDIKNKLINSPVLQYFDPTKEVTLQVDASQKGYGACLMQQGHPIAFASRGVREAENNYAQIEREMAAIVFGCDKFHRYLYGCTVIVQTDHKPLLGILKKSIQQLSPRLQRMRLRLLKYAFKLEYVPGKLMYMADTLSRAPVEEKSSTEDLEFEEDMQQAVLTLSTQFPMTENKLTEYVEATDQDATLKEIKHFIGLGWPRNKNRVSPAVRQFWSLRHELTIVHGLVIWGQRIVIPKSKQPEVLRIIHEGHLGIEKCRRRAQESVFWPGLSVQIKEVVQTCETCIKYRNAQSKEPLLPHPIPERPWEKIAADICEFKGKSYLVVVDYMSKYPELMLLPNKTGNAIVTAFKSVFARHGVPDLLIADNMPFASETVKTFAKEWGMMINTTSPTFAQSNGMSERAVQTVKNMLKKAEDDGSDPYIALLNFRTTPIKGGDFSPSQILMGRRLRTKLPTMTSLLQPHKAPDITPTLLKNQRAQKRYFDQHAKPLPQLRTGDSVYVRLQGHWKPGSVLSEHSAPRSFLVKMEGGGVLRRNRRDLLKAPVRSSVRSSPSTIPARRATATQSVPSNDELKLSGCSRACLRRTVQKPVHLKDYILF